MELWELLLLEKIVGHKTNNGEKTTANKEKL